ncbi:MAG TPA: DUF1223 domain-containing protein [Albitalea sp.]
MVAAVRTAPAERLACNAALERHMSPLPCIRWRSRNRDASTVRIRLARDGDRVNATVVAGAGAPARLSAYWAVTESNHRTVVRAGENDGATLAHDHVVREWVPVAAWNAAAEQVVTLRHPSRHDAGDAAHPRRLNFVVLDASSGRPVQALALDCRSRGSTAGRTQFQRPASPPRL